jgi:purine-binding chemotaxis protein CheW
MPSKGKPIMDHDGEIAQTDQYLTFTLAEETYAIEIVKVREVIDYVQVTRVPRMPAYLRGVINLRGSVVPVLDLRLILGMPSIEKTIDTCVIIAEVQVDGESLHLGMLADSVQEVIDVNPSQIGPPPKLGSMLDTNFIRGMGKRDEGFFIILNVDQVLSVDDAAHIHSAKAASSALEAA